MPPVSVTVVLPLAPVAVPPQLLFRLLGVAISIPVGKVSDSAALVRTNVLGLNIVMLTVEVPPAVITVGEKLLLICAANTACALTVVKPLLANARSSELIKMRRNKVIRLNRDRR